MAKRYATTGEVAKWFEVAPRTVVKWCDAGYFEGVWQFPDSKDRRIPRAGILKMCKKKKMPIPAKLIPHVLLIQCGHLEKELAPLMGTVLYWHAETSFEAGIMVAEGPPYAVIIDMEKIGSVESRQIAKHLHGKLYPTYTLALVPGDRPATSETDFSRAVDSTTPVPKIAHILQEWLAGFGRAQPTRAGKSRRYRHEEDGLPPKESNDQPEEVGK